jgi:SP family sugar:H+ symporter-like MFS transporter
MLYQAVIDLTQLVEPLIERVGYKRAIYATAGLQIVSLISGYPVTSSCNRVISLTYLSVEMTSIHWVQFTIGRNFAYMTVGLVENIVLAYNSEIAPAAVRGLLAGSNTFVVALGNLWGAGMSRAYVSETRNLGWIIPCAMQLIPAVLLLVGVPFCPGSPRWLVLQGKKDQALKNLDRLRKQEEIDSGYTMAEIEAIEQAIVERSAVDHGTWLDLFRGNYLRRSWIARSLFAFQQTNGNQFVNSYGPT